MADKLEEKPSKVSSKTSTINFSKNSSSEVTSVAEPDVASSSDAQSDSSSLTLSSSQCSSLSGDGAVSGSYTGRIDQLNLGLGEGDTGKLEAGKLETDRLRTGKLENSCPSGEKLEWTERSESLDAECSNKKLKTEKSNESDKTGEKQISRETITDIEKGSTTAVSPMTTSSTSTNDLAISVSTSIENMECESVDTDTFKESPNSALGNTEKSDDLLLNDGELTSEGQCSKPENDNVGDVQGTASDDDIVGLVRRIAPEENDVRLRTTMSRSSDDVDDIRDEISTVKSPGDENMEDATEENATEEVSAEVIDAELKELRDTWRPFHETRRRELGRSPRCADTEVFGRRAGASLELARRLMRHCRLDEHEGCVNALHFNDDGTLLASGSDDLRVIVWDWIKGKSRYSFNTGHHSNVFQCKFMPHMNDSHMVTCARDGQVRLAVLTSTGLSGTTRRLAEHRGSAHKIAVKSPHCLYTCGEDAVVMHIDLREDRPKRLCQVKESNKKVELYSIHSNPFKSYEFCVGGRDQFVRIYDARKTLESSGGVLKKFCPQHMINAANARIKANVTCAVYNHDGTEVLGTYNDEDIYVFENKNSDCEVIRFSGHRNSATVKGVNFYGPRSEYIVSGSDCGHVFVWDKKSQKIVNCFYADDGGVVNVLEPHPTAPILATSGLDSDVKIWMPLANEPVLLNGLHKLVNKNKREREMERDQEPDGDSQMLWLLMQHLRRSARRQMRQRRAERNTEDGAEGNDDNESDNSETDSDDTTTSEEDGEEDNESRAQCRPS